MMDQLAFFRRVVRQTVILAAVAGLMFVAGMDWAQAATPRASNTVPGELHVIVLFLATIGFVVRAVMQSQKPARAKARRRNRR